MYTNGLQTSAYHRDDPGPSPLAAGGAPGIAPAFAFAPAAMDSETVARHYLAQARAGAAVPSLAATPGSPGEDATDFKCLGHEAQPLTGTTTVKFYQRYHKIPIYGSLITVELDEPSHEFLSIRSALGTPANVDATARISPQQVQEVISQQGGNLTGPRVNPPRLYYYFDPAAQLWRLVYLAEDVPQGVPTGGPAGGSGFQPLVDYVVDAHTGEFVIALPRTQSTTAVLPTDEALDPPPQLYSFFDSATQIWRLVYVAGDRAPAPTGAGPGVAPAAPVCYLFDVRTNEPVAALPRAQILAGAPAAPAALPVAAPTPVPPAPAGPAPAGPQLLEADVLDGLGRTRHIRYLRDQDGQLKLYDRTRNVQTYDFGFRSYLEDLGTLPGTWVVSPPDPWNTTAVSAHANAIAVADFFVTILKRNGLDNQGSALISSINCLEYAPGTPTAQEWANAVWHGGQMLYGQIMVDGSLRSYAVALDVVAHEMTHGLTEQTARLEYQDMPGALNESYSDIFGVLISNHPECDFDHWDWQIGEEMGGRPLRDLSDPGKYGQPDHMARYVQTPADFGGVHTNSGIHNKAAYNLLTARAADGSYLFTPAEGAALFYLALTAHLTRTSGFGASRGGVETAAKTLFRADSNRDGKLAAVAQAFDDVGIPSENAAGAS